MEQLYFGGGFWLNGNGKFGGDILSGVCYQEHLLLGQGDLGSGI